MNSIKPYLFSGRIFSMTILQIAIIVNIFTLSHQYFSEKKENENQIFEIDIDSLKHSKELPQINLLQIQIGSKAHHKNLSALLIFDSRSFYVASTNQIDRVDLIETEISSTNSANQFVYLKNGKYFAQNFIVSDQTAQIGPYLAIEDCNEIASAKSRSNLFTNSTGNFSNNQIIHLFHYNNIIFACGTSLCGLCIGVSPLLDRSRIYGVGDSSSDSFDSYLNPINFLTSSESSLVFFGNHRQQSQIIYTAFSNDGRKKYLQVPFVTSRIFQSYINDEHKPIVGTKII